MAIDDGRGLGVGASARTRFSASEAAFTGLGVLTREPRTWLIWAALLLAYSLVTGALMVATVGPELMQMNALAASPLAASHPDPAAALARMGKVAPFYGVITVLSLVFYAVAFAAVNRAVLRPGPSRSAHLAMGGDELRQFIVLVLLGLVFLGVYLVSVIVGAIVGGLAVAALVGSHIGASGGVGAVAVVVVLVLLVLGLVAFVMTRLSLASPIALDTGRIDLGASWRMTRGRFWALFGAYLLAWLVSVVLLLATVVVFAAVAAATGGGLAAVGGLFRPNMTSLQTYFTPLQLFWVVVNAATSPILVALGLGAPAGAYAQLRGLEGPVAPGVAPPTAAPASDLPRFGR